MGNIKAEPNANSAGSPDAAPPVVSLLSDTSDEEDNAAPNDAIQRDVEDEVAIVQQDFVEPAAPGVRRMRILSSTYLHERETLTTSMFGDISSLSSPVPFVSSGTMRQLAPIIEAALEEEEKRARDQPNYANVNSMALVRYIPPRHCPDGIEPTASAEAPTTPPNHICSSPLPSAPKKNTTEPALVDVERALQRLNFCDTDEQPTDSMGDAATGVFFDTVYEDIVSPEFSYED